MADCIAARLSAQEQHIEALSREITRLRDGLSGAQVSAALADSPELGNLRSENEKLKYRLVHLRRSLRAELELETHGHASGEKGHEPHNKALSEKGKKTVVEARRKEPKERTLQKNATQAKPPEARNTADKHKKRQKPKEGGAEELHPWPSYISQRLELYERLKKESDTLLSKRAAHSLPIRVQLPDGQDVEAQSWISTPYQLACGISQGLADSCVIARVDGNLWDLDRPLEEDCSLELLRFDHEDARAVYWHSSAHVLGEAMERFYGGCLCYGPPIENGFYYDMFLDGGVSSGEFGDLEAICKNIMKDKQPFERLEISKQTLLEMFKYNKFKCRILNEKVSTPTTTVYRCGPLIDLCRGPHVRHTGKIKALKVYKNSSTYWEGRADMETLQRIYGISFPDKQDVFALKPMNCPGHCLMFSHRPRSWRELPLRLADFGVLHRNELSGTLTGLTRVRRFQQDDAHIFCTVEQIESEMKGCLDFLRCVYDVFGFSFQLHLSTRPEKFLGDITLWNEAEEQLENSLNEFGEPWKLNPGDGAFYGPKIDIKIKDAIGRYHQCATIQLDFQLPIRFSLTYVGKDGDDRARPVIIHRAILGSVERMIAILTENYAGKWPLWLSPHQVMVVPVNPSLEEYASKVCKQFVEAGFMADVDLDASCLLNKKIRNAQLAQYNFILVVGEKEKMTNSVNVRTRDNGIHGELTVPEVLARLMLLRQSRCRNAEEVF
uniref:threonine--tRNA ligase n=1 Tax=Electrophorus electricus TaxID=8005 RepID=A0A4W4E631_ELEEL